MQLRQYDRHIRLHICTRDSFLDLAHDTCTALYLHVNECVRRVSIRPLEPQTGPLTHHMPLGRLLPCRMVVRGGPRASGCARLVSVTSLPVKSVLTDWLYYTQITSTDKNNDDDDQLNE